MPLDLVGGFVDTAMARGHRLRDATVGSSPDAAPSTGEPDIGGPAAPRCTVLIVGAGIAGLAAARALRRAGIDDYRILELDDVPGGNSRGTSVAGLPCPAGAHYLPLPGEAAVEVRELLTELGVRDVEGRYDERMLCHAPQERLYIHGIWQDGLLPVVAQPARTLEAYRRFAERVEALRRLGAFTMPMARGADPRAVGDLARVRFGDWLAAQGLDAEGLRWYLDYCCRDDYGAGIDTVSAWAGVHYFASRHGFTLPETGGGSEGLLTWPQGNGWLAERLLAPHRAHLQCGVAVRRIERQRGGATGEGRLRVETERMGAGPPDPSRSAAGDAATERATLDADWVIWAAPTFVAARVLADDGPAVTAFRQAAARVPHAAWVVANVLIAADWHEASLERMAWDNVRYGSDALGYVDARHQRLDRLGGPRLWTWYRALGTSRQARIDLQTRSWRDWVREIASDLGAAHPTLAPFLRRIEIHRWGHAMAVPTPDAVGSGALDVLRQPIGRFVPAHADLAGYSVFEEAMYWGNRAGERVAAAVAGRAALDSG